MNLPTVTIDGYGGNGLSGIDNLDFQSWGLPMEDGDTLLGRTYALLRVADGQTVTAERRWFCGFADATIVRGDSFEYRRNRCLGDHDSDDRGGRKWVCGWVLLVRGADMEETT